MNERRRVIDRPDPKRQAKDLILEIIKCSEGRLEGRKRLYKAYWMSHVIYFRDYVKNLTRYGVVKMTNGPGIHDFDTLLAELKTESGLNVTVGENAELPKEELYTYDGISPYPADSPIHKAVQEALAWVMSVPYANLSDESHYPSWWEAGMGSPQDYAIDTIDEDEMTEIRKRNRARAKVLARLCPSNE